LLEAMRRREFIRTGLASAGALALGPEFWEALARPARKGRSPYGPLGAPDANGVRLPEGFSSRIIAQGGEPVGDTGYAWHLFSDGASTFRTADGGWILVSNSELPAVPELVGVIPGVGEFGDGGASAIRFTSGGEIVDAYRILADTSTNCAGGATPWGTWLSCEEHDRGLVWECDPAGEREAIARPALGVFKHEAVCVDRRRGHLYLSEDLPESGFYRFTPREPGNLESGRLQIAKVERGGAVRWIRVPDPGAESKPTREQVAGATKFKRGEGIWFDTGIVYLATTGDSTIHAYDVRRERIRKLYNPARLKNPPLTDVDNVTVSRSGDLFVCEDAGGEDPFDIAIITPPPDRRVARFLKLTGAKHGNAESELSSEIAGVCFDPSGRRMYFASQREAFTGALYEVTGPFRGRRH
jgi:secreted PhoX family phosphatase